MLFNAACCFKNKIIIRIIILSKQCNLMYFVFKDIIKSKKINKSKHVINKTQLVGLNRE